MSWTRVRDVEVPATQHLQIFDVGADLSTEKSLKQVRKGAVRELGSILFDPEEYKDTNTQFSLESHKLDENELRRYAEMTSHIRRDISQRVSAMN